MPTEVCEKSIVLEPLVRRNAHFNLGIVDVLMAVDHCGFRGSGTLGRAEDALDTPVWRLVTMPMVVIWKALWAWQFTRW